MNPATVVVCVLVCVSGPVFGKGKVRSQTIAHPVESRIADPALNLLIGNPELRIGYPQLFDLDGDLQLSDADAAAWWEGVVADELEPVAMSASTGRILSFVYDPVRDLNRDGAVNALDFTILTGAIAKERAQQGRGFAFRGIPIDPNQEISYFDGVSVITTTQRAADSPGGGGIGVVPSIGNVEGEYDNCPPVLLGESTFPGLRTWFDSTPVYQFVFACGCSVQFLEVATINEGAYNYASAHLGCGVAGPQVITLSEQRTEKSHVKVEAGFKFDNMFNLGVEWGAESTVTTTHSTSITFSSAVNTEDTFAIRYLKYTCSYRLAYTGGGSCGSGVPLSEACAQALLDIENDVESDVIYTVSSQSKGRKMSCPGCSGGH